VDRKYAAELAGAQRALDAAKHLLTLEQERQDKQILAFEQQKAAAELINDPNQRIAALARIQRAEDAYRSRNGPALAAAQLQADLAQRTADAVKEKSDAEKAGAQGEIARLQEVIKDEKAVIQARLDSIKREGESRIRSLQQAAQVQARSDQAAQQAAQARVAVAQREVDAGQQRVAAIQREDELRQREVAATQHDISLTEARIHHETDGAIAVARTHAADIQAQAAALQTRLDQEQQGIQDRIEHTQRELSLRQSGLDAIAERENAQIDRRLQAAQDGVQAAQDALVPLQAAVDASQAQLDAATHLVEQYQAAAQLAQDRIDAEAKIAQLLKEQRDLLKQQDKGKPSGLPALKPPIANPEGVLRPWTDALSGFMARVRTITDPLGHLISDLLHGDLLLAKLDLSAFGSAGYAILTALFGPRVADAVKAVTDPIGAFGQAALSLALSLRDGLPFFGSFKTFLTQIGVPPEVAGAIAGLVDAIGAGLAPALREITGHLGPALVALWTNLAPSMGALGDIAKLVAEGLGVVLAGAIGLVIGLVDGLVRGITEGLPSLGTALGGVIDVVHGIITTVGGFFEGVVGLVETFVGLFTGKTDDGWAHIQHSFEAMRDGVLETAKGLWDTFSGLVLTVFNFLFGFISGFVDGVIGFFSKLYNDLVGHSIIPDMVNAILGEFQRLVTDGLAFVRGLWKDATDLFTQLATDAATAAVNLRDGVVNAAGELGAQALAKFTELRDGLIGDKGILPAIAAGILAGIGGVVASLTGPKGLIPTAIGELLGTISQFIDVGSNIVAGILQGITDAWHTIVEKLHQLADGLPEPIKKALNMRSPSVEMAEQGGNIVAGLVLGIEQSRIDVRTSMEGLAQDVLTAIQNLVTQTADALAPFGAPFADAVAAIRGIWATLFGPADQEGTILWLFADKKAGWFNLLEQLIRRNLDFQRLEVWQAQFVILTDLIAALLARMRDQAGILATQVGEFVSAGIAAGIRNKIAEIAAAAAEAVRAAISAANEAAQNHSPSRRFAVIGRNMGTGLGVGMGEAGGFVRRMASGLVDVAAGAVALRSLGSLRVPTLSGGAGVAGILPPGALVGAASGPTSNHMQIGAVYFDDRDPDNNLRKQELQRMFTR
jgi:hypothetical protein